VFAWDLSTGERRQVSESTVGVIDSTPTLEGEGVAWFDDETGDEAGRWLVQPFGGARCALVAFDFLDAELPRPFGLVTKCVLERASGVLVSGNRSLRPRVDELECWPEARAQARFDPPKRDSSAKSADTRSRWRELERRSATSRIRGADARAYAASHR
jgi:hypothetical protein